MDFLDQIQKQNLQRKLGVTPTQTLPYYIVITIKYRHFSGIRTYNERVAKSALTRPCHGYIEWQSFCWSRRVQYFYGVSAEVQYHWNLQLETLALDGKMPKNTKVKPPETADNSHFSTLRFRVAHGMATLSWMAIKPISQISLLPNYFLPVPYWISITLKLSKMSLFYSILFYCCYLFYRCKRNPLNTDKNVIVIAFWNPRFTYPLRFYIFIIYQLKITKTRQKWLPIHWFVVGVKIV